ncbi:MAG TPA: thioredoxin family protein [Chitinophagaceae bacterium]|nr:thioredoxin family protein [Chitinophagaceae bacterium]
MKKKIVGLSTVILLVITLTAFKISPYRLLWTGGVLPIGSALPKADLQMKDIANEDISMKDAIRKNGLLVMFTCNTCPYVIKNQERTKAICKFALQNNIGVILLNANEGNRKEEESFEAMQLYAKDQNYQWYYVVDKNNEIADAFGATRTPENFLFNRDSKLVYHGAIDDNPTDAANVSSQHLKEAMKSLLAGKNIAVKESRSVGCAIKRKK